MSERRHWARPGFSALVLMTLAACSGGGGGGSSGGGGSNTPSAGASIPNPYAAAGSNTPNKLGTLHVFGDSYSDIDSPVRSCGNRGAIEHCTPKGQMWSERLVASGSGATLESYARDGASAVNGGVYGTATNDFRNQVDQWSNGLDLGANDLTIVYMGYNDVNTRLVGELPPSIADYATQVERLIAAGATASERRLFLTLLHDFGSTPHDQWNTKTPRSIAMNDGIKGVVDGKANVVAVDMFTVFERIIADPARYGLTNVTGVPGPGVDSSTWLHADGAHFSARGQELVAQVYNHYITRGWDLANSLQGSEANRNKLNDDVDQRLAQLSLIEGGAMGFSTYFVGDDQAAAMGLYDVEAGDPSRSGFAQLTGAGRADAGIGMNYAIDESTRLGLVMSRYGSDRAYDQGANATRLGTESDAVSLYLDTRLGAIDLATRASFADDQHTKATFNDVVGEGNSARHGGRTMSVSQTASTALRVGQAWLQPWVNITHTEQQIDGYTISNAFVSDLTYSGGKITDTTASIGFDATSDAFELGHETRLTLRGGLGYTRSLRADDYTVTIREAALAGLKQRETVERDGVEMLALRFGSALAMGQSLSLSADYALTKQMGVEADHAVTARFNYRF